MQDFQALTPSLSTLNKMKNLILLTFEKKKISSRQHMYLCYDMLKCLAASYFLFHSPIHDVGTRHSRVSNKSLD